MWKRIKSFLLVNQNTRQTVAKNTVWLSISNFGGRLIKAIIIIYGARVLGTAGYGVFSYAITLAGFFTILVDPGINSIFIREGSKASPEERQSLFSTTLIMKAIALTVSAIIVLLIAPLFSTLPGAKILLPLVALLIIFDNGRGFISALFYSEEKMELDAYAFLITNLGIVIFGFIFLFVSPTAFAFTSAYVIGTTIGAVVAVYLARKSFKNILAGASAKRMLAILKVAWPFAIIGALGAFFTNTDILIISWMRTAADVGIYSAAIRIIQLLYLVPAIIQLSTLPILARLAKKEPDKFRSALEGTISLIFMFSFPLSLGGLILGTGIMSLIFGPAYAVGSLAFSILMIGLSFDYATSVMAGAIFAYDHQKSLIISSILGGIVNVLFDLLLIPHWGIAGSSLATLLAQIIINSYLWYVMNKLNRFHILPRMKSIFVASVLMAITTGLLLTMGVEIIANITISGVVYLLVLLLLKEPLLGEIKKILTTGTA